MRELQAADGRDDDRLDDVADLYVDVSVRIRQLLDVDGRLALSADVDERDVRPDGHDGPLDRLALLVGDRLERLVEHPGEVLLFGRIWPWALLGLVIAEHPVTPSEFPIRPLP